VGKFRVYSDRGEETDHAKSSQDLYIECKREAVRLTQTSGKPIAHIARELGISDTMVHQ
jgi:transposase-like protein